MERQNRFKQRLLQISMAAVLILIALLIEVIGIHPEGVYSYASEGYKEFQIGKEKMAVLRQINLEKAIRSIQTCNPDAKIIKKDRRKIELGNDLQSSDIWICYDRTGKHFLFVFNDGKLSRLLIQRLHSGSPNGLPIFETCQPQDVRRIDAYLAGQTRLEVFHKD